jgi:hypothetical protein
MIVVYDPTTLAVEHVVTYYMEDYSKMLNEMGQTHLVSDEQIPHHEIEVYHDGEKHTVRRREFAEVVPPLRDLEPIREHSVTQINDHFERSARHLVPAPTLALARAMLLGNDTALLQQLVSLDDQRLAILDKLTGLSSEQAIHQLVAELGSTISGA